MFKKCNVSLNFLGSSYMITVVLLIKSLSHDVDAVDVPHWSIDNDSPSVGFVKHFFCAISNNIVITNASKHNMILYKV